MINFNKVLGKPQKAGQGQRPLPLPQSLQNSRQQFPPKPAPNPQVGPHRNVSNPAYGYGNQAPPMQQHKYGMVGPNSAPTNNSGGPPSNPQAMNNPEIQHKRATDQLIRDCYSKVMVDKTGKRFTEISYQTHIAIKEFSQFPSLAPPANLPLNQIGTVKDRVLVICVKYSGRVIIQKGKFNEGKNLYQIGRTWDMDELKSISRIGIDGFLLSLNKEYFWKSSEGPERIWKFIRILAKSYGGFMGRYPALSGWSIQDLKLNPLPQKTSINSPQSYGSPVMNYNSPQTNSQNDIILSEPIADPKILRSRSLKKKNMPNPILPPEPKPPLPSQNSNNAYKDMDFTANGKLPMKPMKVMQVDRPGNSSQSVTVNIPSTPEDHYNARDSKSRSSKSSNWQSVKSTPYGTSKEFVDSNSLIDDDDIETLTKSPAHHPYQTRSPLNQSHEIPINDSQSFIFKTSPDRSSNNQDYSQENDGPSSPLRNQKSTSNINGNTLDSLEPLESAAALGNELEQHLENGGGDDSTHTFDFPAPPAINIKQDALSPDFGIEEVEDSDTSARKIEFPSTGNEKGLGINSNKDNYDNNDDKDVDLKDTNPEIIGESTKLDNGSNLIDNSIQEIEDFMDSQLHFDKSGRVINETEPNLNEESYADHTTEDMSGRNLAESTQDDLNEIVEDRPLSPQIPQQEDDFNPELGYALDEDESIFQPEEYQEEPALNINKEKVKEQELEKDAELEEIFDEINWNVNDNSDSLIKKLSKKLGTVKHLNVTELAALNFGEDSVSNDLTTALTEIENLNHIFKKTEIDFKILAPDINLIENNSKGLQVKSINKKLLYNDLKSILDKVSVKSNDLRVIEQFKDFEQFDQMPQLEYLLVELHNALSTIGHNSESDDLSQMKALRQYQNNYEKVSSRFIRHFSRFFSVRFRSSIDEMVSRGERLTPGDLLTSLKQFLVFTGITYFIKSVSTPEFLEFKSFINTSFDFFLEKLITTKLRDIKYTNSSSITSRLSQSFDNHSSSYRKSRSLRLTHKKDKFIGKFGFNDEHANATADGSFNSDTSKPNKTSNEIEDPKIVINMVYEAQDYILAIQFFALRIFLYDTNIPSFGSYIKNYPTLSRIEELRNLDFDQIDSKSYSNELIPNMSAIFGNYINTFMKKVTPTDLIIPVLLLELDTMLHESLKKNQEFFAYSFLKKLIEKFRGIWTKLVKSQAELLNKSNIKGKGGILPVIKNLNQLIFLTESSIQAQGKVYGDIDSTEVRQMLNESYTELTDAAIHLFTRDDPLLKNNDHDDKEREYRNVTIMQNIFFITQQLEDLNTKPTNKLKAQYESVFRSVQDTYFQKLINKNIGKLADFIKNYEIASSQGTRNKKNDKKYLKTLLSGYTDKDIAMKAHEIFKKLEKHIITGQDMFEQDLVRKLWKDMESQFINYFNRLNIIVKDIDRDIDYNISKQEIHHIFTSIHSTR